ncbi:MAG TPA: alpha/beta fold hydrolase [Solirubrobacteraceae bacterium]|jgi:pimeloyl-ACP methyl ester carboxylesterase|nr:alpha/beta fold hydrolase [Solirubrobacteraceae bacterium]
MLMAVSAATCALAGSAGAQIAFAPCGEGNELACGHLTVPLDPSGAAAGTLTLALRRHRAPVGEARSAILALAGGPGQPALPFADEFAELLGPIAATRDLIVFDQRGIGLSHPLSCHAFENSSPYKSFGALIEACGSQLGPTRSFYTTADTVADIEAIRQAGGYEKLVLYGTSYGTKVAEAYAQAYPSHVEALVLDSVVTPNGPEPLERPTFEAIPRVLRQMCAARACAHVTTNPTRDLARVLARMQHGPLEARAFDGTGKPHTVSMSAPELAGSCSPATSQDRCGPNSSPPSPRPPATTRRPSRACCKAGAQKAAMKISTSRCTSQLRAKSRTSPGTGRPPPRRASPRRAPPRKPFLPRRSLRSASPPRCR